MNRILRYACLVITVFVSHAVFGNVISDTIFINTDGYDAFVHSGSSGSNYATDANLYVHRNGIGANTVQRTYLKADLSSIPTYAILTSARLRMYAETVDNTGNHDMLVSRVTSSWTEGGVTWTSFPSITNSGATTIPHDTTKNTGWQNLRITSLVQYAVNYPAQNLGWLIQLSSEGSSTTRGVKYSSSENGTAGRRCYLVVDYVLPIEVEGVVSHCTAGANDGAITVSMSGGDGTWGSYEWFQYSSGTVTSIESGTNMANKDISGLADGLYLFRVRDGGTTAGYKYFMVGEYGATTSVEFRNASSTSNSQLYNEDANLVYDVGTGKGQATGGGGSSDMYAYKSSSLYYSSLLKYQVDFDSVFTINSASLRLISSGHYRNASPATTDSGYVSRVTANWYESYVTWDTKPATTTTNRITINQTSPAGAVTRNDTLDVKNFVLYWQDNPDQNYGIDLSLKKYAQASDAYLRYYSSDHTTAANRPGFVVSYSLPQQIVTTYVDSISLGSIKIVAPNGELPYTYLLSYDTIPDIDDMWDYVKDSIDVDSVTFYHGKTNSHQYTFADLPAEHYFVAVLDNQGRKIFEKEVILSSPLDFISNSDLVITNQELKVAISEPNGKATLDAVIPKSESGAFEFTLSTIGNIVIGLNYQSDPMVSISDDFEYGIEFNSTTKHFQALKSDSVLFEDTVIVGDIFRFAKENYEFVVYRNEYEMYRHQMTELPSDDFKVDALFKTSTGLLAKPVKIDKIKTPKPIGAVIHQTECAEDNGSILMKFNTSMFPSVTGGTYTIKDAASGSTVESGTFTFPVSVLEYLPAGDYKVIYTTTGSPATSWTEYFTIGQPVIWDLQDAYYTPIGSNIITTNSMTNTAHAISQNILTEEVNEGFVTFKLGTKHHFTPWGSPLVFDGAVNSSIRIVEPDEDQVIRLRAFSLGTNIITKYIEVFDETNTIVNTPFAINTEGPFKIRLYNDTLKTYYNNSSTAFAYVVQGTPDDYRVLATSFCGYVKDPYADFCYGSTTSRQCAELDYELNGNYYVTNNGYFCFVFNQEYNDTTITFNIYNRSNVLIATQADFALENMSFLENRVVLDFTGNGFCLGEGYFVLEVINGKNEKFYLRFYNDYLGCIPPLGSSSPLMPSFE